MAWIALPLCAILGVAAIVLLGPPLGHLLFAPGDAQLWPRGWWVTAGQPEPVKHGRYVVATLVPLSLVVVILAGSRRIALRSDAIRILTLASWAMVSVLVAVALLEQHPLLSRGFPASPVISHNMILAAGAFAVAAALASRRPYLMARAAALARETRARRLASLAIAAGFVAIWMLKAPTTDALVQNAVGQSGTWTLNDAVAVLDGRTPLVDYHPVYVKLLPYPAAIALWAFGPTTFVYTTFMAVLAALALLAVYAVFRQVTRSSLSALALFLPFVALTDMEAGQNGSALTMPAMWPMRYGGAYLLAWLVVRHVAGRHPRQLWVIALVAGLVLLNNPEFGVGATVATAAALLCAQPPRSTRDVRRLGLHVVAGLLGALATVSLLTLVRAGSFPRLELLLEWPPLFTNLGWLSLPLPTWELHLALYATFVASIATAAVRLARRDDDTVLTSMLMWSGVFGLLAAGYYVGRPDAGKLTALFSAWSFALSMLTIVSLRGLTSQSWRPTPPRLLVLFGVGLSVCALTAFTTPDKHIARLQHPGVEATYIPQAKQFVSENMRTGETVAILLPLSYRISHSLNIENVTPYAFMNVIVTREQLQTLIDVSKQERVSVIFTPAPGSGLAREGDAAPEQLQELMHAGFRPVAEDMGMIAFRRNW